ncbi:MAG TPA: cyclic nucleotide-binding domain-containing protein [Anaerolineae bacterium]|nr:cyclic nucleotide-binding domain-containing protein [Anaerolineae bacterium]
MGITNAVERLRNFWIFAELGDRDLAHIGDLLLEERVQKDHVLFAQGDRPDFFYLVESGLIQETGTDGTGRVVLRRTIEPGGFLGRWALIHNRRRRATAIAKTNTHLLALRGADLLALLTMYPTLQANLVRTDIIARLLAIPLFRHFSEAQLEHIADLLTVVEYPPQQTIFRQGEVADGFYVVDRGQVLVGDRYVTAGNFFGHSALFARRSIRQQTAIAQQTQVRLFRFKPDAFRWLDELRPGFHREIQQFDIQQHLRKATEFSHCTADDRRLLAGYVGLARYRPGDTLFYQGEFDPTLYFLYEGAVVASSLDQQTKKTTYRHLRAGQNGIGFGQSALFLEEPRDVTVQATAETQLLYLHRADYNYLVQTSPAIEERLNLRPEVQERKQIKPVDWMTADEHLLFRERRHPFVLSMRLSFPILTLLALLVLWILHEPTEQGILGYLLLALLFLNVLWLLWVYVDWRNDYYTVTDQRAVHEEKTLFIRESREEAPLAKVQNVNVSQQFPGQWLGYGTLVIETAVKAEVSKLKFDYLRDPEKVQHLILTQTGHVKAREILEVRQTIREKLDESVGGTLHPLVPRPAIPWPPEETRPPSAAPNPLRRLYAATFGRWFWIEKEEGNKITWRKHWVRLLWRVWMPSLLLLFWIALAIGVQLGFQKVHWGLIAVWVAGLLGLAFWWWWRFENWGNDLYSVTNDRVIDIEALPLGLRSKRTETMFDRIQNVSYEIPNFAATLLNYGTVIISTAGAEGTLNFVYVRDPQGVQAEIFRRLAAYEDQQRRRQQEEQWANLPDWFAEYDRLRQR